VSRLLQRFRHIAIEGPIGVGKSSLSRKLAACLGADFLLERPEDNPFLDRFYAASSSVCAMCSRCLSQACSPMA
jgi:deoxyadenosine/deoxycytidine kinase